MFRVICFFFFLKFKKFKNFQFLFFFKEKDTHLLGNFLINSEYVKYVKWIWFDWQVRVASWLFSLCVFLSVRMNTGSCLCSVRILWWVFWTSVVTQRKWKPFWTVMWTRTRPQNTRDPVWAVSNSPSNMKLKRWEHSYPCKAYSIIFNTQIRPLNNQHDQNFADKPVTHILSSKW